MFKKIGQSIVVGSYGGKLVCLDGQQFVILVVLICLGKGVGVVILNLLEYGELLVVLDIKQENFDLISGWCVSQGQEIYLFNFFVEDWCMYCWNLFSYVFDDLVFWVLDLMSIVVMLYLDGVEDQKFWVSQVCNVFMVFILYLFENWDDECSSGFLGGVGMFMFGVVYWLFFGDGIDLKKYFKILLEWLFFSVNVCLVFVNMLFQVDEIFVLILGIFKELFNFWINLVLDKVISCNDFLLIDVCKKKMIIYIGIQLNKLVESWLIINLFFSQLINFNIKELFKFNLDLKYQCLLLMDEFILIGKVEIIVLVVFYMVGYNIWLLLIIQSMFQFDVIYGWEVLCIIIINYVLQILYVLCEQQDVNDYLDMLGYIMVCRKNVIYVCEKIYNFIEEWCVLMLLQELKVMGLDMEVFLYEGILYLVKCDKICYYKDCYFILRLLLKVDVLMLNV